MSKIKIAIEAGHGSNTAGKRTPPFKKNVDINGDGIYDVKKGEQYREHYANVGVADLLYKNLVKRGYEVIKIGWYDTNSKDDEDEALSVRQKKIKNAHCDSSISIHFNAYGDGNTFNDAKGFCVYIHDKNSGDSNKLAQYAIKELSKGSSQENRGIYKKQLAMCNCSTMNTKASILCELAFMTNEKEATQLMINPKFWAECADELATAVDNYYNSPYTEKEKPANTYKLYHTVKSGDTLTSIAEQYHTTVNLLIKNNKIKTPNKIKIGQKLFIMKYTVYTVKSGDTIDKISKKLLGNEKRYTEIMELNYLKTNTLYVNQLLKIPA